MRPLPPPTYNGSSALPPSPPLQLKLSNSANGYTLLSLTQL